jgi:uncharacterized repeat protein (TIGR03803 family)
MTPKGMLTTLYKFCTQANCVDGAYPAAKLVQGIDGNFYGTTSEGGGGPCNGTVGDYRGCGTIFKVSPTGQLTTLFTFNGTNGEVPNALILAPDGNFYSTTAWGANGGTIFKITPKGQLTTVYSFCIQMGCGGAAPPTGLVLGTDGNFYGTTNYINDCSVNCGGIFKITPSGRLTTLAEGLGSTPGQLIQATDGNLYDITSEGGNNSGGNIFQINSSGSLTTLYNFCTQANCADGEYPATALLQSTDGSFYGTTQLGGEEVGSICATGCGTIYNLSMGLAPFVTFVRPGSKTGQLAQILGEGFAGTTKVSFNGVSATFTVKSKTFLTATVPSGAITGYVTVTTPSGTLTSNVPFHVIP